MLELRSEGCMEVSPKGEGVPVLDLDLIEYERNYRNIVLLEHCYWRAGCGGSSKERYNQRCDLGLMMEVGQCQL